MIPCTVRLVGCLLVAVAAVAHGESLELTVDAPSRACQAARVVATPNPPDDANSHVLARAREWAIGVPGLRTVDLDADLGWTVTAHCAGLWAPEVRLEPGSLGATIAFSLVPTGRLNGRFDGKKMGVAGDLQIRVRPAGPGGKSVWREATLACPLEQGRFTCEVPAGRVDARLAIPGFAPHYAWGVGVPAGGDLDLGLLKLREGASVAGWVRVGRGGGDGLAPRETSVRVAVEPAHHGPVPETELRRIAGRGDHVDADDRGFFQLTGLAPGSYQLSASLPGYSPRRVSPVMLRAGEETLLDDVVELEPLAGLEVFLDPPQDVAGRPWVVRLLGEGSGPPVREVVAHHAATEAGYWNVKGLAAGLYTVRVEDADGSTWSEVPVEVTFGLGPLTVQLDAVAVEGDIRLGDEPVAADVIFGTTHGVPRVRLSSDEEGLFRGVLPREGEWPVEVALDDSRPQALDSVEVRRGPGGVARVSLQLPATCLSGEVVDESGQPAPGAFVLVVREEATPLGVQREAGIEHLRRREASLTAGREGRFEIRGLLAGPLLMTAYDESRSSPWHQVEITEDVEAEPIRLVLRRRSTIFGTVVSPDGPVPGAAVVGFARGVGAALTLFAHSVTAADGTFTLDLNAEDRLLDLVVAPPGYDVVLRRVVVGEKPLVIGVERTGSRLALEGFRAGAALSGGGAELPLDSLLTTLLPLGRVDVERSGIEIEGIEPGTYAACPYRDASGCASGFLGAGSELVLHSAEPAPRKGAP